MDETSGFIAKYWEMLVAAVIGIAAWGEMRLKIASLWARHIKVTDPEFVQKRAMVDQQMASSMEQLAKAVDRIDSRLGAMDSNQSAATKRIWESIESTGQKLAHIEGRLEGMNGKAKA